MFFEVTFKRQVVEYGSCIVEAESEEDALAQARILSKSWSNLRYARDGNKPKPTRIVQTTNKMGGCIAGTEKDL